MTSIPVSANLTLVSLLPSIDEGSKVRFLGCVTQYVTATGLLHLQHPPSPVTVLVNILHVDASARDLQIGAWVNVLGYIEGTKNDGLDQPREKLMAVKGIRGSSKTTDDRVEVKVQALLMWSAGGLDMEAYELAVKAKMDVDQAFRSQGQLGRSTQ